MLFAATQKWLKSLKHGFQEGSKPQITPITQITVGAGAYRRHGTNTPRGSGWRRRAIVAKALCPPDVDVDPKIPSFKEIDRNLIVDRDDLAAFEMTWRRLFAKRHQTISAKERTIFLNSFAKDISPKAIKQFISETDRIILRHTTAEYQVLDMLRDNRQLMVQGGPGSGKTWLALEQASVLQTKACKYCSFATDFPISQDVAIGRNNELGQESSLSDNPAGLTGRRAP